MTALLLALSLSNTFTKVGAIVAIAAILGIALLSMLFFAQARELKRLREWSEEEPRRMAELEHRLTSALSLRIQRATAQVARPAKAASAPAVGVGSMAAKGTAVDVEPVVRRVDAPRFLPAAPAVVGGNVAAPPAGEALPEAQRAAPPEPLSPVAAQGDEDSRGRAGARAGRCRRRGRGAAAVASAPSSAPVAAAAPPAAAGAPPAPAAPAPSAPRAPTPPPRPARGAPPRPAEDGAPARRAAATVPRRPRAARRRHSPAGARSLRAVPCAAAAGLLRGRPSCARNARPGALAC